MALKKFFDMTIGEHYGLDRTPGDIGVELEVEGKLIRPDVKRSFFWKEHDEGSLRGQSTEFVLDKPVPHNMLHQAIEELATDTVRCKFNANSERTSVHVHINVQQFTARELYSVMMLFWTFENILVHMNGPSREGNLFCQRTMDAEGLFRNVLTQVRNHQMWNDRDGRRRYAALNLSSLSKFGSLEFRFIRGLTDFALIELWASELYRFCNIARKYTWSHIIKLLLTEQGATRLGTVEKFFSPEFLTEMQKHVTPDYMIAAMQENLDNIYILYRALQKSEKRLAPAIRGDEDDESDQSPGYDFGAVGRAQVGQQVRANRARPDFIDPVMRVAQRMWDLAPARPVVMNRPGDMIQYDDIPVQLDIPEAENPNDE